MGLKTRDIFSESFDLRSILMKRRVRCGTRLIWKTTVCNLGSGISSPSLVLVVLTGKLRSCFILVSYPRALEVDEAKLHNNGIGDPSIVPNLIKHENTVWNVQHHLRGSMY